MQARSYPDVGNKAVAYPDLGAEFRVIPLNTIAKRSIVGQGLEDETDDEMLDENGNRKL